MHQHLGELLLHRVVAFPEVQRLLLGWHHRHIKLQALGQPGSSLLVYLLDHVGKDSGGNIVLGFGILHIGLRAASRS